jgi:uncharacterized protein (UPF0147 family)
MLTPSQSQALYPVLQHYTGSKITSISEDGDDLVFRTFLGEQGFLTEEISGDWTIMIGGEVVYKIEKDVFNALVNPNDKRSLEDYIDILDDLYNSPEVSYRSRVLVVNILKFLEEYILSSDFLPKKSLRVGISEIFNCDGKKFVNCLN